MATKVGNRIEELFSIAVGLEQTGRMKSTIYCLKDRIIIRNGDNSLMLELSLREGENPFEHPVAFKADDYDSKEFTEKDGFIHFITKNNGWVKDVSSRVPGSSPEEVAAVFDKLANQAADMIDQCDNRITLDKGIISLLNHDLSHIEFMTDDSGKLVIIQRNIYSGSIIHLSRDNKSGFGLAQRSGAQDIITKPISPVGLRTPDFLALFSFTDSIQLNFCDPEGKLVWIDCPDTRLSMVGVVGGCTYDQMGTIRSALKETCDGREE